MPRRRRSRSSSATQVVALLIVLILAAIYIFQQSGGNTGALQLPTLPGISLGTSQATRPAVQASTPTAGSWYTLYFTNPDEPSAPGPDRPLVEAIHQAKQSVDVAAYSLSLDSVRDALMQAKDRGVNVRVVMESDNMDGEVPAALEDGGIEVLGDRREGLMHDKFVVIDRSQVWTGSMNLTTSGAYQDNNNFMQIRSSEVAQDYETEFEEMFVSDQFGTSGSANTPNPALTLDGTRLEIYFSPDDGVSAHVEQALKSAEQSIYFLAYSFTSDPLANIIVEKAQNGVIVGGVFEEAQYRSNVGTEYDRFRAAGLDVHLDGNPGQMHHKVMIIDEKVVIFGSYNFSASAEDRNDENLLIVYSPEIASQFLAEYRKVYNEAQP